MNISGDARIDRAWLDRIDPPINKWAADPVLWAKERLKIHLWSKQRQILSALVDGDVAVHSCHGVGKSYAAATAICWWIDAHPPGTAFAVTSAPTGDQVKAILWREIGKLHKQGRLAGRTNLTEWYIEGELVGIGRKPNDYEPAAFQGIHAPFVLVVLDEACGIPEELWDAASTLAINEQSRQLAIGNPDDPHGHFRRVCLPTSAWKVIHIGASDAPNFTGETVPPVIKDSTISAKWVEAKKLEWGETSSLYQSKVLGIFPSDADDGVIPGSMIAHCRLLDLAGDGVMRAGLDVGGGGDRTVLALRSGPVLLRWWEWRESDPMVAVGQIVEHLQEWQVSSVAVDVTGIGWGLAGRLTELSSKHNPMGETTHQAEVVKVNFAEQSREPARFLNRRAELWWDVGREHTRLATWDLSAINDDVQAELAAPRYEIVDSSGKVRVEKKDEIIKRLGRSPDVAEAILLAFFDKTAPVVTAARQILSATVPGVNLRRDIT